MRFRDTKSREGKGANDERGQPHTVDDVTRIPHRQDLVDIALRDEIDLVSDLILAATARSDHMTEAEIDRALGVSLETTQRQRVAAGM